MRGKPIRARPIATICCSPPDSVPTNWLRRSASRGNSSSTQARRCLTASVSIDTGALAHAAELQVFQHRQAAEQVAHLRHLHHAFGKVLWGARPAMSVPSSTMRPRAGRKPLMALISVLLPLPLAPSKATISPSFTCSDTPCRISLLP